MESHSFLTRAKWLLAGSVTVLLAMLTAGGAFFASCEPPAPGGETASVYTKAELVARGKYLVNTSACHDCHTPKILTPNGPELDTTRLLSGYASSTPIPNVRKDVLKDWVLFGQEFTSAAGPWGLTFAANLTSDETGTGNWTEQQFFTAIRKGKYKGLEGARDLLPPMPWQMYSGMTDVDLKAIFEYLRTTKPIRNIVPAPIAPEDLPVQAESRMARN